MLRSSSYSIVSEPLPGGGFALMNGLTGAIDVVSDDVAAAFVASGRLRASRGVRYVPSEGVKAATSFEVRDAWSSLPREVVDVLCERGHLTQLDHDAERAQIVELAEALHDEAMQRPVFLVVPNYDCNYRCTYCFERPLQNALPQHSMKRLSVIGSEANYGNDNVVMRQGQVDGVFKAINQIRRSAGDDSDHGQIILYGGEPLDHTNQEVVFAIVRRGQAEDFVFAAITNGHDLQHFIPLLGTSGINQVQISIDGPKRIHDRQRVYRGKESSFDRLVENIHLVLAETDVFIQIRTHVNPSNIDDFAELLEFFSDQGWTNNTAVVIYANTIYKKSKAGEVEVDLENYEIDLRLRALADAYSNVFLNAAAVNARMVLMPALRGGKPYRLHGTYCSANTGQYIFAPDNHIYSCWESVGKSSSRIGSYSDFGDVELDPQAIKQWFSRSVAGVPECRECPFALVCGGGCAQYAEYNHGTLYAPYCDDFDRVFRVALAETVEEFLALSGADVDQTSAKGGMLKAYYG